MIGEEEIAIFEYELMKLMDEYRKCVDQSLKMNIQEDIVLLRSVIFSAGSRPQIMES